MRLRTFFSSLPFVLLSGGALAQGPFDGPWNVQQTCPAAGDAKGYTNNFDMTVNGGRVLGQRGTKGTPSSATLSGQIGPDGAASLKIDGFTGDAAQTIGGGSPGQPYSYPFSATFQQNSGTGTRTHGRPCTFAFRKLGAPRGQAQSTSLCGQKVNYRHAIPGTAGGAAELIGVWQGELTANNSYQREYYRCLGIVIESVALDGTVAAKYGFGDSLKFSMQGSFAVKPTQGSWQGKLVNNTLTLGDHLRNVRPAGGKRLEGNFVDKWGHGPVWFNRQ